MSLCKYKNIFGAEKTGPHKYRFLGMAIVDLILTIIGALIIAAVIAYFTRYKFFIVFAIVFVIVMILGIIFHRLFCVNTTINKLIFGIV